MPFDKHIIGQVPAVISAAFNVSKLQKEDGTLGPRAIRSPLPSPLDICRTTREGLISCGLSQSPALDEGEFRILHSWRWSTGEKHTGEQPSCRHGAVCREAEFLCVIMDVTGGLLSHVF